MANIGAHSKPHLPANCEGVVNLMAVGYPKLSAGCQQRARFFTQNPNTIALESINGIAAKCAVHPSSLVRFAQHWGYTGFKQLQAIFQTRLATAAMGFRERISALEGEFSKSQSQGNYGLLRELVVRDIATLQGVLGSVSEEALTDAAKLLANAQTIYIAGQLRSEPIAQLLRYLLTMLNRKVILLDPAGGLTQEMAMTMGAKDGLMAIAFRHYAKKVVTIFEYATKKKVPVIAMTDSQLSPLAKQARVLFTIPEDEYIFLRSLAAPMCLAQCIATVTAVALQPNRSTPPRIPSVTKIARDRSAKLFKKNTPRTKAIR